jgi:hypothetical protein
MATGYKGYCTIKKEADRAHQIPITMPTIIKDEPINTYTMTNVTEIPLPPNTPGPSTSANIPGTSGLEMHSMSGNVLPPIAAMMAIDEFFEITQATNLVHQIIYEVEKWGISVNWKHNNGQAMDRTKEREEVISKMAFQIIYNLGYLTPQYQYYIMSMVNFLRHKHHEAALEASRYWQHQKLLGAHLEFSEETLVYVYNQVVLGQTQVMQMVSHMTVADNTNIKFP